MWRVASCKARKEDNKKEDTKNDYIVKPDEVINKKYNLCKIDKATFVQMQQNDETL